MNIVDTLKTNFEQLQNSLTDAPSFGVTLAFYSIAGIVVILLVLMNEYIRRRKK